MNRKIFLFGFQDINHLKMDHFHKHIMHIMYVQKSVLILFKEHMLNIKLIEDIQILRCFNNILQNLNWEILFLVYLKGKVLLLA